MPSVNGYADMTTHTTMTDQQLRFLEIMRRHIRPEDKVETDREFIATVWSRYLQALAAPLIDPNE